MAIEFDVITDTATLAVFDLQAIRHRASDTFDWWSIQIDEISEVNEGNIAFLNLGADGRYQVKVVENLVAPSGGVYLKVPSGQVFIGVGEDTSGGGWSLTVRMQHKASLSTSKQEITIWAIRSRMGKFV